MKCDECKEDSTCIYVTRDNGRLCDECYDKLKGGRQCDDHLSLSGIELV